MRFPLSLHKSMTGYLTGTLVRRVKRFPLVLMLEVTHRCNLACAGCDRIRLHRETESKDFPLRECLASVDECGAPVVTVTGGEPLLYPDIGSLIEELLRRKKHIYLCTNGICAEEFLDTAEPHPFVTLNFHIDGMEETHDRIANRSGTFSQAVRGIRKAKSRGFRVSTNTSVYRNTGIPELESLFLFLREARVDGMLVSPAFSYESVEGDIFLNRQESIAKFRMMEPFFSRFPIINSPLYTDFLMGKREMQCTPWGNPTRSSLGWKSPCYLITDAYYPTYREMMDLTQWDRYGTGRDPRCRNCMLHCGYEATAVRDAFSSPGDILRLIRWNLENP